MKKSKKRRQLTNKRKRFLIANAFLALFLFIGIGYSALNANLNILGSITVMNPIQPIIKPTSSTDTSAFRSDTYREKIKTITLDNQINPPENIIDSWDIGVEENGNVMAYITENSDDNTMYDLYIQGDGHLYANEDSSYLFYNLRGVDSITGIDKLDTSRVTNMSYMFAKIGSTSLIFTLDLGDNFDTRNVTDMSFMFESAGSGSLEFTLNLGDKFDTRNVTNMHSMFEQTGSSSYVFTLDLGEKFDTSNVTDMFAIFTSTGYVSKVFTLDLGDKFDTSNVTDMSYMFGTTGFYSEVFTLDLGDKFDTSNVTNMRYMFNETGSNNTDFTLDLGDKFDTSNVTDMHYMFYSTGFSNPLFTLNLRDKFDTRNVTDMSYMFELVGHSNNNLILDLSSFDFSNVTSYSNMFDEWQSTQKIYVKNASDQSWIITNGGNTNLTTANVLIKT